MKKILILLSILLLLAACAPQPAKPSVEVSAQEANVNVGVMPPVAAPEVVETEEVKPSGQTPIIGGIENISAEAKSWAVDIKGSAFNPGTVTIKVGETITWTNSDSAPHTVTDISGPESFDSGSIAKDGSFSHTFAKAGKYTYKCSIHPSMNGVIVVQ